jgi:hypothetical protein
MTIDQDLEKIALQEKRLQFRPGAGRRCSILTGTPLLASGALRSFDFSPRTEIAIVLTTPTHLYRVRDSWNFM